MTEITFKNNPIHLEGTEVSKGDVAPNFKVLDNSLNEVTLDNFKGQKKLISVVPSIDTGVCDQQTRKFNEEASQENGVVLTISADLPFAQKRWCASNGHYGVVMKEMRLLARSVFVLDENNHVVYKELVQEGTDFPNFEAALEAYRNI